MGLQYFDEDTAEWFFGRQAVTDAWWKQCVPPLFSSDRASGSGKSSVVRAGWCGDKSPLPISISSKGHHPIIHP